MEKRNEKNKESLQKTEQQCNSDASKKDTICGRKIKYSEIAKRFDQLMAIAHELDKNYRPDYYYDFSKIVDDEGNPISDDEIKKLIINCDSISFIMNNFLTEVFKSADKGQELRDFYTKNSILSLKTAYWNFEEGIAPYKYLLYEHVSEEDKKKILENAVSEFQKVVEFFNEELNGYEKYIKKN